MLKYAKPCASDSLKETRDKDSRLAAALKRWFWQSRVLPILSRRPEIRIPAWRQLSKRRVFNQMPLKALFCVKYAKPCASDSLKETRDKDSSLAAALKQWFWQSRVLPILSKRPEIRIPAWRQLSKRRLSTRCLPKVLFCVKYAKPCASHSLKETRDKDPSLAAALKMTVFNHFQPYALQKCFFVFNMQSRVLPILSKRPELRIPGWQQL